MFPRADFFPIRFDRLANFAGNLAVCLSSGVDLKKAIRTSSGELARSIGAFQEVYRLIETGESLSQALRPLGKRLPPFFVLVVECGEQTGRLDQALAFLAEHCRMLHRPREALRNAWLLPMMILIAGNLLTFLLVLFLGSWSRTVTAAMELVTTCGSLAAIVILFVATPLKLLLDQVKLVLPFVSSLERELAVNRFLHVFAMLYGTGGRRVESMIRQSAATVGNYWLQQDLARTAIAVERGSTLTEAFDIATTFDRDEKGELAAGDAAGRLAETATRIADRAGQSAATRLTWITRVAVRLTMGLVVMSLAGALLPLLSLWMLSRLGQ